MDFNNNWPQPKQTMLGGGEKRQQPAKAYTWDILDKWDRPETMLKKSTKTLFIVKKKLPPSIYVLISFKKIKKKHIASRTKTKYIKWKSQHNYTTCSSGKRQERPRGQVAFDRMTASWQCIQQVLVVSSWGKSSRPDRDDGQTC